jgi:hypothetical protein
LLNIDNTDAHKALGYPRAYKFQIEEAVAEFERTLQLNPNHADVWGLRISRSSRGSPKRPWNALAMPSRSIPGPSQYSWLHGWAEYACGR